VLFRDDADAVILDPQESDRFDWQRSVANFFAGRVTLPTKQQLAVAVEEWHTSLEVGRDAVDIWHHFSFAEERIQEDARSPHSLSDQSGQGGQNCLLLGQKGLRRMRLLLLGEHEPRREKGTPILGLTPRKGVNQFVPGLNKVESEGQNSDVLCRVNDLFAFDRLGLGEELLNRFLFDANFRRHQIFVRVGKLNDYQTNIISQSFGHEMAPS